MPSFKHNKILQISLADQRRSDPDPALLDPDPTLTKFVRKFWGIHKMSAENLIYIFSNLLNTWGFTVL